MDSIFSERKSTICSVLFVNFNDQFYLKEITCRIMNDPESAENDKMYLTDFAINFSKDLIHVYK